MKQERILHYTKGKGVKNKSSYTENGKVEQKKKQLVKQEKVFTYSNSVSECQEVVINYQVTLQHFAMLLDCDVYGCLPSPRHRKQIDLTIWN